MYFLLTSPLNRLVTELGCEAETRMCILVFFLKSYGRPWARPMGPGPWALAHGHWPWALAHILVFFGTRMHILVFSHKPASTP